VGRERELEELLGALEDAARGHGHLVLLTGEPGIGKTRLMVELAQLAARRDVRVVTGRCWEEGGAPPYWPWIQILRSAGGDLEQLAASEAESHARGTASGVTPESERIRLFDAVARFLTDESAETPLLLTLDDVHAADEPSLLMLRFLGQTLSGTRLMLVASYRDADGRVRERSDVFAELTESADGSRSAASRPTTSATTSRR
jgi:predicted ATPase